MRFGWVLVDAVLVARMKGDVEEVGWVGGLASSLGLMAASIWSPVVVHPGGVVADDKSGLRSAAMSISITNPVFSSTCRKELQAPR